MTKHPPITEPARKPSAVQKRIPLNVLFGLPDDGTARVQILDDGKRLDFALLGTASIVPHISTERFALNMLYLHPSQEVPVRLGPGALLNHVGDPDLCSGSLLLIDRIVDKAGRPCFNPPAAVVRSTRDGVARALTGLPGLDVPKTIRVHTKSTDAVLAAIEQSGLAFPVLVRVAGAHGGEDTVRIERPQDGDEIGKLNDGGRGLYVTEFRDFMSPDGHYRKSRIVVVGEDIFLRHHIVGKEWMLHTGDRAANTQAEEIAVFGAFETEWAPHFRPLFREIGRRLGLDFFGVDCNIDPSGRVTLFEANACMLILKNTRPSPNMWDAPIARILAAVEELIATPQKWRDFHRFKGGK
jgi:glutathione synthase/RimK-type ligase-like ATP-grasp enzyme